VSDIDSRGSLNGNVYQINTAVTSGAAISFIATGVGGVGGRIGVGYTASGQLALVVSTDHNLNVPAPGLAPLPTPPTGTQAPASGLLGWFQRKTGREY